MCLPVAAVFAMDLTALAHIVIAVFTVRFCHYLIGFLELHWRGTASYKSPWSPLVVGLRAMVAVKQG
ncbi:MAG: hypothetical protein R6U88_04025 [Candidatus Bipolaricaulota bacterium]